MLLAARSIEEIAADCFALLQRPATTTSCLARAREADLTDPARHTVHRALPILDLHGSGMTTRV